ncbi:DUF3558 domain-containing protein [Streptomyces sp. NPDC048275]|uniref:DUF3558 domain-containing protein n=1 Tax=Streptomyces sp. NPDC048275 TaxID=3155629 RepID=UPI003401A7AB
MQRKAYVSGVAALLAALLAGCTGGSGSDDTTDDAKPGSGATTTPAAAQPGRYRTLPEACAAVDEDSLDSLLPGIEQITDQDGRDTAYEGTATPTYDTDRRVGCSWKVESTNATDHLRVDFERVVSYDNAVSDDSRAEDVYGTEETQADLPEPSPSATASDSATGTGTDATPTDESSATPTPSDTSPTATSASPGAAETLASLQPRILDDLGDQAFLNDKLSTTSSTSQQRTVTVVFRTSNVIVTIEYTEQPTASATAFNTAPDSKEMQDKARKLAEKLVDRLNS